MDNFRIICNFCIASGKDFDTHIHLHPDNTFTVACFTCGNAEYITGFEDPTKRQKILAREKEALKKELKGIKKNKS